MLTKRIIPCLDVKNGNVVKGIHFLGLKKVGDPVALAKKYYLDGADELVFLDISATVEKRKTMVDIVNKVAKEIYIPLSAPAINMARTSSIVEMPPPTVKGI